MAHFSQAFWSNDYAGGLGVLFGKLQQGVQENQQVLTIARMRADAEELYGQHMGDIGPATDKISDGFLRDDGATVRKAYDGVRTEMEEAARKHRNIASNIRELVVYPFHRWCEQHALRVQNSQDDLQARIKAHDKQAEATRKLRSQYYNKCRLVEDLEEEDKLAFKDPSDPPPTAGLTSPQSPPKVKIQEPEEEQEPASFEIGDQVYDAESVKRMLMHMMDTIKMGDVKVPILGTYNNASTGADIVVFIQKNMEGATVSYAEQVGQDLLNNGFLRLIGNVGSTFANSSRMNYQWRPKAFRLAGYPEKKKGLERSNTTFSDSIDSPIVGSVSEYLSNWNPLNNPYPNETPANRLRREARESDERYKAAVKKQDLLRCTLEEAMFEHLKFMERCELDRLKAIKSVILDFSGAISNVIPSLQSTVDKMMLFQETVQPANDLRYLLENYRVGSFAPRVQIYENYYSSVDGQTFGVDLEAKARSEKKKVPLIVTTILTFLDHHYPLLEGDEARRAIWLIDVPLAATHTLRKEINDNPDQLSHELLDRYEVPIVASTLKLYLLELPDSIVSSGLYEVIRTIYTNPATADPSASSTRVSVLQNTLSQLRLTNIVTLDAITTHFARFLDLTSADEAYISGLISSLAPCILRPRNETSLSLEEKHNHRFLRDLLEHKGEIFNELKRNASALSHSSSVARAMSTAEGRPRAISTDESNRRANMEERQRAIASRSRASSPTPPQNREGATILEQQRHRRDSSRGAETRFPVNATGAAQRHSRTPSSVPRTQASSLEVPSSAESSPIVERTQARPVNGNGIEDNVESEPPSATYVPGSTDLGKRDSFGRSQPVKTWHTRKPDSGLAKPTYSARESIEQARASLEGNRPVGVELTDKPMDD